LLAGAVNVTVASSSPAVAVPIVGAPGNTAFTVNVCVTSSAGRKPALPSSFALIVQSPALRNVNAPPVVIVQTLGVDELNTTASPDGAVAVSVGVVPKSSAPGFVKLIVCA